MLVSQQDEAFRLEQRARRLRDHLLSRGVAEGAAGQSSGMGDERRQLDSEWPGKRTETSTRGWVAKMRSLNKERQSDDTREKDRKETEPVHLPLYDRMSPLDLLLTVEHCDGCENHTSMR